MPEKRKVTEYFVGRQPIFAADGQLTAYELLFRAAADDQSALLNDGDAATARVVIGMYGAAGIGALSGGKRLFVNATYNMLISGVLQSLPPELVIVEVLEDVPATPRLLQALGELREAGFTLALDDWQDDPERAGLIALADIVKLEVGLYPAADLARVSADFRARGIELLAEKVETAEQHSQCLELGFSYFQGYYYARPETLRQQQVSPGRLAALRLVALLQNDGAETSEVSALVESDPALSLRVLRFANSAQVGRGRKFGAIRDAVVALGTRRIQDIATLTSMTGLAPRGSDSTRRALIRARSCELLADRYGASARSAFLAGLLSSLEFMLNLPLSELIKELPLEEDIRQALLGTGESGVSRCLTDTLNYEQDPGQLEPGSAPTWRFSRCYLEAIAWANSTADELGIV